MIPTRRVFRGAAVDYHLIVGGGLVEASPPTLPAAVIQYMVNNGGLRLSWSLLSHWSE